MPLTYTEATLDCQGMLSVVPFDLVGDGRRLFFNIPNGTLKKEVYTVIDGKLNESPFRNGSRMETPIRGLERVVQSPHESYAIVVDRGEYSLGSIPLTSLKPIPVTFDDGQKACISLTGALYASACITDTCQLVKTYLNCSLTSPEATITATMEDCMTRLSPHLVRDALRHADPHEALGLVDSIALDLADEVAAEAQRRLGWMRITSCRLDLQVANVEELVRLSNTVYEERKAVKEKLLDVFLQTYGKSPIPPEMVQLLVSYAQTHPGEDASKLISLCTELKNLCQLHTPAAVFQQCRQMGLLGGP